MIKFTSDLSTFCIYVAGKNVENDVFDQNFFKYHGELGMPSFLMEGHG